MPSVDMGLRPGMPGAAPNPPLVVFVHDQR